MFNSIIRIAATAALICGISVASAAPISYTFSASGFYGDSGTTAPVNSVSGSMTLDELSVLSFAMTLGSQTYGVADVGADQTNGFYSYLYGPYTVVGGLTCAVKCAIVGIDDFWLSFAPSHLLNIGSFTYTASGVSDVFRSSPLIISQISAVPEPATATTFLIGAAILGGMAVRRRS